MAIKIGYQPRKQRRFRYRAPLHVRQKMVAAHLSPELRKELGRRSLPVRKGDKVRIMRGKFRGKEGVVARVDLRRLKVFVEGITQKKANGTEVLFPLDPSNLMIIEVDRSDERRFA
ncbi:MAG: large subunit ribosomal protein [Candidatus Diapherotrites archaeon]|nr:large subunit ribosomal protein [Candidatus Diapherotrites archaeon]MDN5366933.1 large subunit ribosomal protein [Candidatus Diapherotrites archaeon]